MVDEKVKSDIRSILIGKTGDDVLTLTDEVKETGRNISNTLLQDINKTLSELDTVKVAESTSEKTSSRKEGETSLEDLIMLRLEPKIKSYISDNSEKVISNLIDKKLKELLKN